MFTHDTQIRVRYSETDQMGYVYHGNYAQYYELGRVESLRSLGYSYKGMEEMGFSMPVMLMECKFLKPALYDDLLTIRTLVRNKPSARMVFEYEVYNEQMELLNRGSTTLVFIDRKTNRPTRCPEFLMERMELFFQET